MGKWESSGVLRTMHFYSLCRFLKFLQALLPDHFKGMFITQFVSLQKMCTKDSAFSGSSPSKCVASPKKKCCFIPLKGHEAHLLDGKRSCGHSKRSMQVCSCRDAMLHWDFLSWAGEAGLFDLLVPTWHRSPTHPLPRSPLPPSTPTHPVLRLPALCLRIQG